MLQWKKQDITSAHPKATILISGDLQITPRGEDPRSHYVPLRSFCEESNLTHINPTDIHAFVPAKTHQDHWLLRHAINPAHNTIHKTNTLTYIPEYGDHKDLIFDLPQIGGIQTHNTKHTHPNPTTRSHPSFILPISRHQVDLYRLGNEPSKQIHNQPAYHKNSTRR